MANLRTKQGILKALWEKTQVEDKEKVISISFFLCGGVQIPLQISEKDVTLHPETENVEKINTISYLKYVYYNLDLICTAVVSRVEGYKCSQGGFYSVTYRDSILSLE